MFSWDGHIWTAIHFAALSGLALYGLHRGWLLICWYRERQGSAISPQVQLPKENLPTVTAQLPIFNERFVAARLMDAAATLNWPKEKMEIQILDDSTDDTRKIIDERLDYWQRKGINMKVLRRSHREAYKAGALNNGLTQANGEYIAIFDADFVPPSDFLLRSMGCFSDQKIGMVQARWGFLNSEHSWLTRIQSLLLGPHFSIEHWVRFRRGLFFNFNGTAGIWRRCTIESAGGWQHDTVTEDLDLSYRAQLAGWRFIYLDDLEVPSELPVTMSAFRSQQQRWAKGSIQTARKILPRILTSDLPIHVKVESFAHLLGNLGWLLGAILTLTLYPVIIWRVGIGPYQLMKIDLPLFIITSCAIMFYFFSYSRFHKKCGSSLWLLLLPVLSIGMAPTFALSVLNGAVRKGGVFERTPKFGLRGKERLPILSHIYGQQSLPYLILNIFLLVYSILPAMFAWQRGTLVALPFLVVFPLGFSMVVVKDLKELKQH
jgi:cellulose synthase/poly-beta-1,6-N-acetylglucosamine synthase-like glycosyltransferase